MANVTVRNLEQSLVDSLNEIAQARGVAREHMLAELLAQFVTEDRTSAVLGWVKLDRWGEIDDRDEVHDAYAECPSCGQDIDTSMAFMAVLGSGKMEGPYCAGCASSD